MHEFSTEIPRPLTEEERIAASVAKHLSDSEHALLNQQIVRGFSCQLKARFELDRLQMLLAGKANA